MNPSNSRKVGVRAAGHMMVVAPSPGFGAAVPLRFMASATIAAIHTFPSSLRQSHSQAA
jgi:hypothetical protein